jgi:copper chaperone
MNENNNTTNKTTTVTAPEIVCGGCATSIKKALGNIEGISAIEVDVDSKKVKVDHGETVSREAIIDALDRAGFEAA